MFNGLIKEIARVKSFENSTLSLFATHKPALGDSIAVNGACLSVTALFEGGFSVQLSHESEKSLATENLKNRVHIEPALRLGAPIEGHLMQGHIDGIGKIINIEKKSSSKDIFISLPKHLEPLVANKGSIGVDGVSLTVSSLFSGGFRLTLIPISLKESLFDTYEINRRVNLESDLIARYLQKLVGAKAPASSDLQRFGYLY